MTFRKGLCYYCNRRAQAYRPDTGVPVCEDHQVKQTPKVTVPPYADDFDWKPDNGY